MSEIKNGKLGLYGAEHSKCNHMMTLGFKGLRAFTYCLGCIKTYWAHWLKIGLKGADRKPCGVASA